MDLLLQEFDIEIKDRKGSENSVMDHLSRIFIEFTDDLVGFSNYFANGQLFAISHASLSWFAYIVNYLATLKIPPLLVNSTRIRLSLWYLWYQSIEMVVKLDY